MFSLFMSIIFTWGFIVSCLVLFGTEISFTGLVFSGSLLKTFWSQATILLLSCPLVYTSNFKADLFFNNFSTFRSSNIILPW